MRTLMNLVNAVTSLPGVRAIRPMLVKLQKRRLRGLVLSYYRNTEDPEIRKIVEYIESHPALDLEPGTRPLSAAADFARPTDFSVRRDGGCPFPSVIIGKNRVYFPADFSDAQVQAAVATACCEAHPESPHAYLSDMFNVDKGDVAVLAGASDGIFCLSIIERVARVYLFEPDKRWIEPLGLTLASWKDKVNIVPLFLGNKDGDGWTSLDRYLANKEQVVNYLQADVEGGETDVLQGAREILRKSRPVRVSICCYHKSGDQAQLSSLLTTLGFEIAYSPGYYLQYREPYLRRGVIRARKA
ncbi:MAG: FkbM family methyltransferase [Phycisphaerae bacterium]|jgi:hypothetical protein